MGVRGGEDIEIPSRPFDDAVLNDAIARTDLELVPSNVVLLSSLVVRSIRWVSPSRG